MTVAALRVGGGLILLYLVSLAFGIFVVVDSARRPTWQWRQARSNKVLWLIFEIITLAGFLCVLVGVLYMTVVRPRLIAAERSGPPPFTPQWGGGYPGAQGYPGQGGGPWPGHAPPPPAPGWAPPHAAPPGVTAPGSEPGGEGPPLYPPTASTPPPHAAPPPVEAPPFGWYPDPSGRHELRYWDGTRWTEYVSDGGEQSTEPLPF